MASRTMQSLIRKVTPIVARQELQQKSLSKRFAHPFPFEQADMSSSIATHTSRSVSPTSTSSNEIANKSAYATVAPTLHNSNSPSGASKFRVPFDEGAPMASTLDNIVEQVESIPSDVQKERGYHIIGKVKANHEDIKRILAVGDMRIWQ